MSVLQEAFGDKISPLPTSHKICGGWIFRSEDRERILSVWRKEMNCFDLTREQKALQGRARRFSKEVILPVAA